MEILIHSLHKTIKMKPLFTILIALTVFACSEKTKSENQVPIPQLYNYATIEGFGEEIFKLIKSDNYNEILELMPDMNKYSTYIKNSYLDDAHKQESLNNLEENLKSNFEYLKQTYTSLREETERSGINWSKCNLNHIDYQVNKTDNIEHADITLNFTFKGVGYKIRLSNCVKMENKWFVGNGINWISSRSYSSYR